MRGHVCPSVGGLVCWFVCLSVCQSVGLSVCLSVSVSRKSNKAANFYIFLHSCNIACRPTFIFIPSFIHSFNRSQNNRLLIKMFINCWLIGWFLGLSLCLYVCLPVCGCCFVTHMLKSHKIARFGVFLHYCNLACLSTFIFISSFIH